MTIIGDSNVGSHQTINIKPYGYDGSDILLTASGDEGFVSIDGKRTYINLFGESTDAPMIRANSTYNANENQIKPTKTFQPGITGSGYVAVAETETVNIKKVPSHHQQQQYSQNRLVLKPKVPSQLPPVRIDTCIVGDDSTCDKAQNEKCRTENGVSSCSCKQGSNNDNTDNISDLCHNFICFSIRNQQVMQEENIVTFVEKLYRLLFPCALIDIMIGKLSGTHHSTIQHPSHLDP